MECRQGREGVRKSWPILIKTAVRFILLLSAVAQTACSSGPLPIPEFSTSDMEIAEPNLGEPYDEPIVITPKLRKGVRISFRSAVRTVGVRSNALSTPRKQSDFDYRGEFVVLEETGGVPSRIRGSWTANAIKFKEGTGEAWIQGKGEVQSQNDGYDLLKTRLKALSTSHYSLPKQVKTIRVGDRWTTEPNEYFTCSSRLMAVGKRDGRIYAKIQSRDIARKKMEQSTDSIEYVVVFDVELGLAIYEKKVRCSQFWGEGMESSHRMVMLQSSKIK